MITKRGFIGYVFLYVILLCLLFVMTACAAKSEAPVVITDCQVAKEAGIILCEENEICSEDGECYPCGDNEQPCCEDGSCHDHNICGRDNICHTCGDNQEPCCTGEVCEEGTICNSAGYCESCGKEDQPCCAGGACADWEICTTDNICQSCGWNGQPPCEGEVCEEWHFIEDGLCVNCGGPNLPICPDRGCISWYIPFNCPDCVGWELLDGSCLNPFKIFPNDYGIEYCDNLEEHNDWCYWHAAYFKKEPIICESILDGEKRELCEKGANPENYFEIEIPIYVPVFGS